MDASALRRPFCPRASAIPLVYKDGSDGLFTSTALPDTFSALGDANCGARLGRGPAVRKWEKPAAPTPRAAGFTFFSGLAQRARERRSALPSRPSQMERPADRISVETHDYHGGHGRAGAPCVATWVLRGSRTRR